MTNIIATINLKGGVGKTTTTVALAEFLAGEFNKKVLIIDLDPQTNASTMLIGDAKWEQLNNAGHTLHQLFADALVEDATARTFDLDSTLQRNASPVKAVRSVDLLPSSLDLIDLQDRLASIPAGRYFSNNPIELLARATRTLVDDYDYVLIDCPPNLGIIPLNGLRLADGLVTPTIPDVLSTYGIPQILRRVESFAGELGQDIVPYGIIISKFRSASKVHQDIAARLRRSGDAPVFDTVIPEGNPIAGAAESSATSTLRQRWGYQGHADIYGKLARELMDAVDSYWREEEVD